MGQPFDTIREHLRLRLREHRTPDYIILSPDLQRSFLFDLDKYFLSSVKGIKEVAFDGVKILVAADLPQGTILEAYEVKPREVKP